MKKETGFTLIELLAVIVILAILLLIATPIILNVIEDAKKASFKVTAGMIVRAADNEYSSRMINNKDLTNLIYRYVNGSYNGDKDLEYKGTRPKDGVVSITEEGKVELAIHNGTYCAWKESGSDEIFIAKKAKEDCEIEIEQEPTDASCFVYEEAINIESFDINHGACMVVLANAGMGFSEEEINSICSGNGYTGLTSKELINYGFIDAGLLEGYGVIYNVVKNTNGIKITDYSDSCPKDVVIPKEIDGKQVLRIGSNAFENKELSSAIIPNSVEIIENSAFRSNQLISVTLGSNVIVIGEFSFEENQLTSVVIPGSVKYLSGFESNQITKVVVPNNVRFLDGFYDNQLTSIEISNSVIHIGNWAFRLNQLTSVAIPKNVTSVGNLAFAENQLTKNSVTIDNCPDAVTIAEDSFINNNEEVEPVYIGENCGELTPEICFQFNENDRTIYGYDWDQCSMNIVIPNKINGVSVEHIGDYAFHSGAEVGKIISDKLELVSTEGMYLTEIQNSILSVILPNSLKTIGNYAFSENSLKFIKIPEGVITIGSDAFSYNQLTSVILPGSVITIRKGAFSKNQLTEITIPNSVTAIEFFTFAWNQLTEVTVPESVTTIADESFAYNQLTSVMLPEGVTTIGSGAFWHNQLTEVVIPESVTTIGSGAFSGNQLTEVIIPQNVTTIGSYLFSSNQLTSVIIPNSVTIIGSSAFSDNLLISITIPASVTKIENWAFQNNRITQGNAKIDNSAGNVILGASVFANNGPSGNQTITPVYLR